MITSVIEVRAKKVTVTEDRLAVELSDGRTISVPLAWYPRLQLGTPDERNHCRLIGGGEGIHWPDLDEDVSVENLVLGRHSGESPSSFRRWREARTRRHYVERIAASASPSSEMRKQRLKKG